MLKKAFQNSIEVDAETKGGVEPGLDSVPSYIVVAIG